MYKANLRFAIEKYSQFEMDVLLELYKAQSGSRLPFPSYLSLLIRRLLDAGLVQVLENKTGMWVGPVKTTPDFLMITRGGRDFVESLGIRDMGY